MAGDVCRTPDATSTLRRVTRQSTPSLIAEQLREAIMHGVLAPGSQLGEVELAARFGVSRGPPRARPCRGWCRRDCCAANTTVAFS